MTDYCSLEEVREYGKFKAADTDHDGLLTDLIGRISKLVEIKCGRVLVPDIPTTHYFLEGDISDGWRGGDSEAGDLILDDTLLTVTSLTNGDGTTIAASEYWLLPRSYERKSFIRIKEASTVDWTFTTDGYIEVRGLWGYSATIPDDVRQAVIETVLFSFNKAGDKTLVADRTVVSPDGARYLPIAWPLAAREVLEHYRRRV